jgi:hypothetical protein
VLFPNYTPRVACWFPALLLSTALLSCPGPFLTTELRATIHEPMLRTCGAQCMHIRTHTHMPTDNVSPSTHAHCKVVDLAAHATSALTEL